MRVEKSTVAAAGAWWPLVSSRKMERPPGEGEVRVRVRVRLGVGWGWGGEGKGGWG